MNEIPPKTDTPLDEIEKPLSDEIESKLSDEIPSADVETPPLPPPPEPADSPPPPRSYPPPPQQYEKSPALAAFLSIWPGLGHLYVGTYQRAAMLFLGIFAIIYLLPLPVNVFMCLFVWFFGIFDAYRQAQLANLGDDETLPTPARGQGSLMFGVFLTVLGAILLLNNFFPFSFEWLRDWWPAIVVLMGLYLIVSTAVGRARSRGKRTSETPDFLE